LENISKPEVKSNKKFNINYRWEFIFVGHESTKNDNDNDETIIVGNSSIDFIFSSIKYYILNRENENVPTEEKKKPTRECAKTNST
jgi:hypothetical protein